MKKIIFFSLLLFCLSGCYRIKYDSFSKAQVLLMMQKFQDLEASKNLPPLIQVFDMDSKMTKALSKKGIKLFFITGAIYLDGPFKNQHAVIVQVKKANGEPSVFIDFRTLKVDGQTLSAAGVNSAKGICPQPPDCKPSIQD